MVYGAQNNQSSWVNLPDPLFVGTTDNAGTPYTTYFPGKIADVAVYNYALSPGQVEEHYAAGSVVASDWPALPASGQGACRVTDYQYDALGRLIQVLGPAHNVNGVNVRTTTRYAYFVEDETAFGAGIGDIDMGAISCTVYTDNPYETWSLAGYTTESTPNSGVWDTFTPVDTISVKQYDRDGRVIGEGQQLLAWEDDNAYALPSGAYGGLTTYIYGQSGLLSEARVRGINSTGTGPGYTATDYGYDAMGRCNRVQDPVGDITRTVYDARGNVLSTWMGTNDTGATDADPTGNNATGNNIVEVSSYTYDADGNCTSATEYVDSDSAHNRVTSYEYDWRDRLQYTILPADAQGRVTYTEDDYDNLDRVVETKQYWDYNNNGPDSGDRLLADSTADYDSLGQVFRTTTYTVSQTTYAHTGDSLVDNYWYDAAGDLIKSQAGGTQEFTKYRYDGLGQVTNVYTGYDVGEDSYEAAASLIGDTIFEQTDNTYDAAGELILTADHQRFYDDTTTTGALTGSNSRTSYTGYWYDEIGRQTATGDYGVLSAAPSRSQSAPAWDNPDGILVSAVAYCYNEAGELQTDATDSAGHVTRTTYDLSGNPIQVIQNYVDGNPTTGSSTDDVTTTSSYDGGLLSTVTVQSGYTTETTKYVYGTATSDSSPGIYRNDLLRAVIYADSSDSYDAQTDTLHGVVDPVTFEELYDRVEYKYDRQGEVTEMEDQNQTVHDYTYDNLGRQISDSVTLPSGNPADIDTSVMRIEDGYNVRGQLETVTSYDAATGGNVVNQVEYAYNDAGLVSREYQEHQGAVDQNTLYTEYDYAGASQGYRPTAVEYPNGRVIHYTYGATGSADDNLNRVAAICDDDGYGNPGQVLAAYRYLGLGTIVTEDYQQPELKLDYTGGGDTYTGLDRFNRVVDQLWTNYGTSQTADEYQYGYDLSGDVLWQENVVADNQSPAKNLDELYTYDDQGGLTSVTRGQLDTAHDAVLTGTEDFAQSWTLDGLGNWSNFQNDQNGDGTPDLDQTRTSNGANEITSASDWITPVYDQAGNMTAAPEPARKRPRRFTWSTTPGTGW